MARLNEPPVAPAPVQAPAHAPSLDSLDAVKRKFLRQNRELAKTNSQQSIRIRTLENDCSCLIAENLSLREHVLHLQNAVQREAQGPSFSAIDSVKSLLESKIQELGGLVAELGQINKREGAQQCKGEPSATKKSAEERQWRSALGLQEVEDAMMPTIVEDKFYPRVTMNAEELQDMFGEPDNQSPDIGPPPVSRFETETPIAFDPHPSERQPEDIAYSEESTLHSNLETRRRRRESGPRDNVRRVSLFDSPPDEAGGAPPNILKVGAKRKFSVQEDEEKIQAQAESFQFSRRNAQSSVEGSGAGEEPRPLSPCRPILASKPVNTDPVLSPKKQRANPVDKPEKKRTARSRSAIPCDTQPVLPSNMPAPVASAETHLDSLPPKTPAAELAFSPPSTEPSTSRPLSKDTPPPGDLDAGNQSGISGRPSRRVRSQVSYKEPSLATKMRRPGKELVDAVHVDHPQRTSVDSQAFSSSHPTTDTQGPDDSAWKPMGVVGTRTGGDEGEVGSPLRQKLDRKEGTQDAKPEPPKLNSSATSQAISALIKESKRKSLTPVEMLAMKSMQDAPSAPQMKDRKPRVQISESQDDMAIFDFDESSPPTDAPCPARPVTELAKIARTARRHSSVPASAASEQKRADTAVKSDGGRSVGHRRIGSSGTSTSTVGNTAGTTAATRISLKERQNRVSTIPSSGSSLEPKGRLGSDEPGTRAERVANRRKSSMV